MTNEQKQWIDNADYYSLLRKWRHSQIGDPMLQEGVGEYFAKVMFEKRNALPHDEQVAASKAVGWGRQ